MLASRAPAYETRSFGNTPSVQEPDHPDRASSPSCIVDMACCHLRGVVHGAEAMRRITRCRPQQQPRENLPL